MAVGDPKNWLAPNWQDKLTIQVNPDLDISTVSSTKIGKKSTTLPN